MEKIKSFTLYQEYYELITLLPEKEQQELLLAITKYMFEDIEPVLNDRQTKIFNNLKRPLDKSKKKSKNGSTITTNENQNEIKTKSKRNQNEIKKKSHQDVIVNVNNNVNVLKEIGYGEEKTLYDYLEKNFGRTLSPIEYETVEKWQDSELTRYAIKQAVLNGAYNLKYIETILLTYKTKNIQTVQQAQKDDEDFKNKRSGKKVIEENPDWTEQDVEANEVSDEEAKAFEERLKGIK